MLRFLCNFSSFQLKFLTRPLCRVFSFGRVTSRPRNASEAEQDQRECAGFGHEVAIHDTPDENLVGESRSCTTSKPTSGSNVIGDEPSGSAISKKRR